MSELPVYTKQYNIIMSTDIASTFLAYILAIDAMMNLLIN